MAVARRNKFLSPYFGYRLTRTVRLVPDRGSPPARGPVAGHRPLRDTCAAASERGARSWISRLAGGSRRRSRSRRMPRLPASVTVTAHRTSRLTSTIGGRMTSDRRPLLALAALVIGTRPSTRGWRSSSRRRASIPTSTSTGAALRRWARARGLRLRGRALRARPVFPALLAPILAVAGDRETAYRPSTRR